MQTAYHRRKGFSLIEAMVGLGVMALVITGGLIISTGIFSAVVAGSIASTMLFTRIAADHENRADFSSSMRVGMEVLSFDVRNAQRVTTRSDTSFSLLFPDASTVSYAYDEKTAVVTRSQSGQSRTVFRNVREFDLLKSADDESTDSALTYDTNKISIEKLIFGAGSGSKGSSKISMADLSFSIRNRQ